MCGRFVLDRKTTDLVALFDVDVQGDVMPNPSWNIAPTDQISIVIDSLPKSASATEVTEPVRRLESARWGLVPGWSKNPSSGPPLFNARSEDAATKPSFRNAIARRRAVVPASGYYEWKKVGDAKVPQFIALPGDELLLFAGIYEWWKNPAVDDDAPDRWLLSASILTRASAGDLATIHDRMPVFLDADLVDEWLDPAEAGTDELVQEVAAAGAVVAQRALFHEVGRDVGSVRNNGESLIAPIA